MTLHELRIKCTNVAKEHWDLDFNLPIEISKRMTSTYGLCSYKECVNGTRHPLKLKFSHNLLVNYKPETIDSVILHEVCHWAMLVLNKPHKDSDSYFQKECIRIGASLTGTIKKAGILHKVMCEKCGRTISGCSEQRKNNLINKSNSGNWRSSCCKAKFVYIGCEKVEDTYVTKEPKNNQKGGK